MERKTYPLLFITGTDTDCGKTVLTSALLAAAAGMGVDCAGIKAVQTGCCKEGEQLLAPDAEFFKCAAPQAQVLALRKFEAASSPHLAARLEGGAVELGPLVQTIKKYAGEHSLTVVEGAGGVLTPLNGKETIADLISQCGASVILAVPNKLGAINQALLSIEALKSRAIPVLGFVLNQLAPLPQGDSVSIKILADNPRTISKISGVPCLAEIPFLADLNAPEGGSKASAKLGKILSKVLEALSGMGRSAI